MAKTRIKKKQIMLTLTPYAYEVLQDLADERGISKTAIVEQMLRDKAKEEEM